MRKLPLQRKLKWDGHVVPRNQALLQAIRSRKVDKVFQHEQAYILSLCATPNGCDIHFILSAVNAHHRSSQDPQRIGAHIWELTQRGLLERNGEDRGKYRVKAHVIMKAEEILVEGHGIVAE